MGERCGLRSVRIRVLLDSTGECDLWRRHIDHLRAGSTVPSPETNAEDEGSLESVLFPQSPPVSETPTRTLSAPSDVPASIQPQTARSTASDLSTN